MTSEFLNVSRETIEKLRAFERLAKKWTTKINLVSKESAENLWDRHILDSVQVYNAASNDWRHWVDLGSGGGFPGVVVAILAGEHTDAHKVTLIESDARKCAFLRAALRKTGANAHVLTQRIEELDPQEADIVSARALADLTSLLGFTERHLRRGGTAIFPKGVRWRQEVEAAKSLWKFDFEPVRSDLAADAVILKIKGVSRV
ncbi:16S rRNA (guanine(527)-N(7))-methyltransferase RsmG [Roseovarius sp. S4756]|uniref:16S rRNA (guanine(527)-N(7))-methyltransferase RsmG n=1 Tax=Roseovarius maritimus TaxID=3342637 RepID=UPI00372A9A61